jgi:MoaA/NifB/PqqE/SkfB family radical SAM enzyme
LPIDLLSACLQDAASLGYRQLAVSGGEPLLYRPLSALLSHARALGFVNTITTNGMLATAARWGPIADLVDLVAVSVDGRPTEHDALRRRAGAFAATIANLEVIRGSGVPFGFIFTLTQHNVDCLDFIVRLAADQGARSVQVHPLTLHGRAIKALTGSRPDGIELAAAIVEARRLGDKLGVVVHVDALTVQQLVAYRHEVVPGRPISEFVDVSPTLVVESDGWVVPLTHEVDRSLALGRLGNASLRTLTQDWLARGGGEMLVGACERTWAEVVADGSDLPVYWYDEVAERTVASGAPKNRQSRVGQVVGAHLGPPGIR